MSFRTVTILCNYLVCLFSSFLQNEVIFSLLFPQQLAKCPEQSWIVSKGGGKGIFLRRHLLITSDQSDLERSSVSEKLTQKFYGNDDEISAVLISK